MPRRIWSPSNKPILDATRVHASGRLFLPASVTTGMSELPPFAYAGPVDTLATSPAYPVAVATTITSVRITTDGGGLAIYDGATFDVVPGDLVAVEVVTITPNVTVGVVVNGSLALGTYTLGSTASNLLVVLRTVPV